MSPFLGPHNQSPGDSQHRPITLPLLREFRAQSSRRVPPQHSLLHELENDLIYRHNGSCETSASGDDGSRDWTWSRLVSSGGHFPSHSWVALEQRAVSSTHTSKGRVCSFAVTHTKNETIRVLVRRRRNNVVVQCSDALQVLPENDLESRSRM